MSLVFLNEDGNGSIYDQHGNGARDIVDDEGEKYNIKQLVTYESYKEVNKNRPPPVEEDQLDTEIAVSEKTKMTSKSYTEYSNRDRERFFHFKLQRLMSIRAAARLVESIRRKSHTDLYMLYKSPLNMDDVG